LKISPQCFIWILHGLWLGTFMVHYPIHCEHLISKKKNGEWINHLKWTSLRIIFKLKCLNNPLVKWITTMLDKSSSYSDLWHVDWLRYILCEHWWLDCFGYDSSLTAVCCNGHSGLSIWNSLFSHNAQKHAYLRCLEIWELSLLFLENCCHIPFADCINEVDISIFFTSIQVYLEDTGYSVYQAVYSAVLPNMCSFLAYCA
jgi:hypothetical protein